MTNLERKRELLEREAKRIRNLPHVFISVDNEPKFETNIMNDAINYVRDYILKKPFWETNSLVIKCYKKLSSNEDYKNMFKSDSVKSYEKNIMFKDDKRKYKCIRCRRETEVCGFCSSCYPQVYGLKEKEPMWIRIEDIQYNPKFMDIINNDREYTEKIKESVLAEGMKNPIILDNNNYILIGHHRFFIAKELGWDGVPAVYNPIRFGHNYFYEGKGYDLYVTRIDNNLEASSTDGEYIYTTMNDFDVLELGKTLIIECFLNIGSDIRLRDVFIPERGHIVDQTWKDWWINKFGKDAR